MNTKWAMTAVLAVVSAAAAQGVAPALMVQSKGKSVPLRTSRVDVQVRILGYVAQTSMTLTFRNDLDRPLAGELYFPLPQGAVVSGYALDINKRLVDAVAVEKDRGRQVLETEMRKGVDPGLVEWTRGNNFRTRVFPIPARGTRTVRVDYVSELPPGKGSTSWGLPLNFREKVDEFRLRVEVVRGPQQPVVARGGPDGLAFEKWQDGYAAEKTLKNAALAQDLVIDLPETDLPPVLVEKDELGDVYFVVNDFPAVPPAEPGPRPGNTTVFWDASGSRGQGPRKREIELLKRFLAGADTRVELVVFRDAAEPARRFEVRGGDTKELSAALENVIYDGGTQLGCISPRPGAAPDLYLLFSDGLSTIGREEVENLAAPLIAVSADTSADHALLASLAGRTGGQYLNLGRLDERAALELMGKPVFSFLSATIDGKSVAADDLAYPSQPQAVQGRFTLAGRLADASRPAKLVLSYGTAGKVTQQSTLEVSPGRAVAGSMLRRLWGQKKVEQLMARPEANESQIAAVGKQFGLVTPRTSLIVLESLEQYLEHEIAPPKTLPEMRNAYLAEMDARTARKKKEDQSKLDRVLAMWNERVKWWQSEFKYPKDFRYKESQKDEQAAVASPPAGRPPTINAPRTGAAAPEPARPMAPPPPAPAAAPREGNGRGLFDEDRADRGGVPAERSVAPSQLAGGQGGGGPAFALKGDDSSRVAQPGVMVKAWDPKTPYLEAIKRAEPARRYEAYLAQRKAFAASPAFFLDCGDYFLQQGDAATGLRVLSNLAELELENAALIRVLAYRLAQAGQLDLAAGLFEEALKMRPEEPQSYRDLALVLARRGLERADRNVRRRSEEEAQADAKAARGDLQRAMDLLAKVVMGKWDRFEEIEVIALMELNRVLAVAERALPGQAPRPMLDERLIKLLDCDVRIVLTWDADMTDMDLHVVEPTGERAFYSHNRTTIGGLVSKDFTDGYGPEEYLLRKAMPGMYKVEINYFGSRAATIQGPVTVQAEVITHFGRPNEKRRSLTLRLTEKKETFELGQIEF